MREEMTIGRSDRIRTYDPLVPNQMRYQTALRSDWPAFYLWAPGSNAAPGHFRIVDAPPGAHDIGTFAHPVEV